MYKVKKLLPLLFIGVLLAGCNGTITNLTPRVAFRNTDNLYPVEAKFDTSQQTLRWENVKATAIVGSDLYPMRNTQLMTNRWETLIPVASGNNVIYYRFKLDYTYNVFGAPPQSDSKLSRLYRLEIKDH
jgi:hypothetical protein